MTQKDKKLNCLNCRIGDFKHNLCDCHNGFCAKYKGIGVEEDFFMAIEALSDRPHGEWIETTSGTICSNCGEYPYDDGEYHIANWHSDFCPSCGADMGQQK